MDKATETLRLVLQTIVHGDGDTFERLYECRKMIEATLADLEATGAAERKFSVREIDALRGAIENKYLYGRYTPPTLPTYVSRTYNEVDKSRVVEEMVRTHMAAGHTADDLIAAEAEDLIPIYSSKVKD